MKKVILTLVVFAIAIASYIAFSYYDNSDIEGTITITLIDEIGDTISTIDIDFKSEYTLFDLLDENFEVGCADSSYHLTSDCDKGLLSSRVLMKIDSMETDWTNTYIAIYENGEYSLLGIDNMSLNDGDIYVFEYHIIGGDN